MFTSLVSSIKAQGKKLDSMKELLVEELRDIYDAEQQIIEALPDMIDAASDPQLKRDFQLHLEETHRQRERLDQVFSMLGESADGGSCDGMKGIIMEGSTLCKAEGDPKVKDAALIAAAQRVEHYEISAYGAARSFANHIGRSDVASILQETLDEEGATDKKLTDLALSEVNVSATRGTTVGSV